MRRHLRRMYDIEYRTDRVIQVLKDVSLTENRYARIDLMFLKGIFEPIHQVL